MYHEDWLMSQIRLLAAAIARTVFGRDTLVYEVHDVERKTDTDALFERLLLLIQSGNINEAEDLLFDALTPDDHAFLLLAVDFYQRLNALSDAQLEQSSFSRQEIYDGLVEAERIYGINV